MNKTQIILFKYLCSTLLRIHASFSAMVMNLLNVKAALDCIFLLTTIFSEISKLYPKLENFENYTSIVYLVFEILISSAH
jgi:hypothetical protein